jgi:hypothetical protein
LFYVFFFQWQHKTFFISTEALWWFLVQNKWIFYFYFMLKRILRKQDHFSNTVTVIYWNIEKAIKNLNFEDTLYALPEKLYITFVNQSALQNFQDFCSRLFDFSCKFDNVACLYLSTTKLNRLENFCSWSFLKIHNCAKLNITYDWNFQEDSCK